MPPLRRTGLTVIYEEQGDRSRQTDDESSIGTKHSINSYRTFAHPDDPTYTRPSTIAAVIKIQAFVRSALTRQRVCQMVDELIDQLKRQLAIIKIQAFVRSGLTRIRVCKMLDELIADLKRQIEQRKEQIRQEKQQREQNESSMSSLFGSFFSTSSSSLNSLSFSSPTRTMKKLFKKKRKFDVIKETLEDSLQFKPPLTISQSLCDNPLHVQEQMLLKEGGSAASRELALSRWKLVKLAMKFVTNLKEVTEHKISIGVVKPEIKIMILQGQLEINRGIPTQEHRTSFTPLMEQAASIGKKQRLTEKVIETTKEEEVVEFDSDDEYYDAEEDYYIDINGTSNDNGNNGNGSSPTTASAATAAAATAASPSSETRESLKKAPKPTTMSPKWSRKQKVHLPKITGRRSMEQHVLLEAVAMGRLRRLKPHVTTNYDVSDDDEEEEEEEEDYTNGKKKKDILDWWDPDNEVHYDSLEDVPLPTQELPKTPLMRLSKASANTSTTNHMQELHVRKKHNLFDDDALNNSKMAATLNNKNRKSSLALLGVAEAACDRERRLFSKKSKTSSNESINNNNPTMMDMDHTKLRMTQKCKCKYCKTSNPYQTNAYRKLWLKERGLLMPSKMNLAALSKKFEKNNNRR